MPGVESLCPDCRLPGQRLPLGVESGNLAQRKLPGLELVEVEKETMEPGRLIPTSPTKVVYNLEKYPVSHVFGGLAGLAGEGSPGAYPAVPPGNSNT